MHSNIPYPVYFAFEDDNINDVSVKVKSNDANGQPSTATIGSYKLVAVASDPKRITSPNIANIQGWLPRVKFDGDSNQLPTIAIVASYNTFGDAPSLSMGSDNNGSSVVALLKIVRLFSVLYSNPKTRDYVICLNSVGSHGNQLHLHVSKPPENACIQQIFQGFSTLAEELGLQVGLKHKKINISNPRVAWEYEQFSRMRVTATTLSGLSTAPELLESKGGLADNRHFTSKVSIIRSVKLVAESIARHIYSQEKKIISIFADDSSLVVNPSYIKSWLDLLSKTPRVAPFLSKNNPLIKALEKNLADHTAEVNVQHETLDGMFTFYDSTSGKLHIY
ncbi:hypothetical protein CQW23_06975 [Capsicum baccatum]|uniref:Uncharacterized protein n=1 Tax=Capsicum baccatum TaxID=33114 RepID=A0A2G2X4X7_CAPBA|nr:hypothetical protein CQW23_06975 [Capsicum baccatum]